MSQTNTRFFLGVGALLAAPLFAADPFLPGIEAFKLPLSLDEVSGMEQSRANAGVFWVHNDSGDKPRVYAVSRSGALLGTYTLQGATAIDWEDMSIGPAGDPAGGPAPNGGYYLYMADIGDNSARRDSIKIYRVPEPAVKPDQAAVTATLSGVTAYEFVYEDGPRDAESFFVDPLTNDFYIVSKRELDGNRLYRASAPLTEGINKFVRVGQFPFSGATGADISRDGMQVIIRRYSSASNPFTPAIGAASYWRRTSASTSIVDLLKQPGAIVPLVPEYQGEAIAFSSDSRGFYSTGERPGGPDGPPSPVTFYAPAYTPAR